jgi:hypothetical protein
MSHMDYDYYCFWIVTILTLYLSFWLFQYAGESIGLVLLVLIGFSDRTIANVVFPGIILYSAMRRWHV